MCELFVPLHRWMGLAIAGFLFVLGLSGALTPGATKSTRR